jgi:hypothetical protein
MKRWIIWTAAAAPVAAIGYVLIGVDVRPHVEYVEEIIQLVKVVMVFFILAKCKICAEYVVEIMKLVRAVMVYCGQERK